MLLICLFIAASQAQELLSNPRCNLQMDRGSCIQFTVHWYYDRYDHRCRRFYYGGCEGNENRFQTLEECSAACHYEPPSDRERCFQPHDPGTCDNDIERWFFDMNKKQCVCSWWSGCGGNSNLFYSYNHCMFYCGQYAEHGPGIDEKYWGSRNRSALSKSSAAILSQAGSTYQTGFQQSQPSQTVTSHPRIQYFSEGEPLLYRHVGQQDRSRSYQESQSHQDRSQSYQIDQLSQDRSQPYQHGAQRYPRPSQSSRRDGGQFYQDQTQSYQADQPYQDRSQQYPRPSQASRRDSQFYQSQSQSYQADQSYQDRSQSYQQHVQQYPRPSQSSRRDSYQDQSQSYQDRSQQYPRPSQTSRRDSLSYQDQSQTYQAGQHYQDRSQQYPRPSQSSRRDGQSYQDQSQTFDAGQSYQDRSQQYPRPSQSSRRDSQSYQDQSQAYQVGQHYQDRSQQYPRPSQSSRLSSQSYGLPEQQYPGQEQAGRDNYDQTLRSDSGEHQTRIQQSTSPNGRTVVITRTGPGYRDQRVEKQEWREAAQPSSRFSEFRSSTSHSTTSHSHFHHSDSSQGYYHRTGWYNATVPRAHGERIYRYDSGPVTRTHPNGTTTINRQTIYISGNRKPSMKLVQHLPGLVEFTRITPPPPFLTMLPPQLRRKLKKLMKMKIPPRRIRPLPSQATSTQPNRPVTKITEETTFIHWYEDIPTGQNQTMTNSSSWSSNNIERERHTSSRTPASRKSGHREKPSVAVSSQAATSQLTSLDGPASKITEETTLIHWHENIPTGQNQTPNPIDRRPQHGERERHVNNQTPTSQGVTDQRAQSNVFVSSPPPDPRPHQQRRRPQNESLTGPVLVQNVIYPPTSRTQLRQVQELVKPQDEVLDARVVFHTSPPPTTRVEAEPIDIIRPVVTSVPATKVDFDDVLAMESQDDYEDYEEASEEADVITQLPTQAPSSTTTTELPKDPPSYRRPLPPIVMPPPGYGSSTQDDRNANIISGTIAKSNVPTTLSRRTSTIGKSNLEAEKQLHVLPPTSPPTVPAEFPSQSSQWTPIVFPVANQTTTQSTVGEDYTENVEFEIQTIGVDG